MKILMVNNLFPPIIFGGYEILCKLTAESLETRGHTVRILTSHFRSNDVPPDPAVHRLLHLTTDFPLPNQNVTKVDFSLAAMNRVAKYNRKMTAQVIKETNPDIVFCWCLNRMSLGSVFAAQECDIPVCYTINDEHPKQFNMRAECRSAKDIARIAAEKYVWKMATYRGLRPFPMTIISEFLKQKLIRMGTPLQDAVVIYQGVPLADFPFDPAPEQAVTRILYAGQLSSAKGVHTILNALIGLHDKGFNAFHLDIAGDGVPEYKQRLVEIMTAGKIVDHVTFLGLVPRDRIAKVYREHHIFIFSSEWDEPFGLTHLEAMASGCAVISTTTGGTGELIRDSINALAYEAGDAPALAQKVALLANDESRRQELIKMGRKWVEDHHSLEGYVDQLETFIMAAVANARTELPDAEGASR